MLLDTKGRADVRVDTHSVMTPVDIQAKVSGILLISGETVVAKVSGETVTALVSGATVTAKISGDKVLVITASGDYVVVSGTVIAKISGDTVLAKVSGESLTQASGAWVIARASGETVRALISGDTVIAKVSGETLISKISGETLLAKVSGETLTQASGAYVKATVAAVTPPSGETDGYPGWVGVHPGPGPSVSGAMRQANNLSGGVVLHSGSILSVLVKNMPGNADMYIGGAAARPYSGAGFCLASGEGFVIDVDTLDEIYVFACTSGQYVTWLALDYYTA